MPGYIIAQHDPKNNHHTTSIYASPFNTEKMAEGRKEARKHGVEGWSYGIDTDPEDLIHGLPQTFHVTLGKLLDLSMTQLPISKNWDN